MIISVTSTLPPSVELMKRIWNWGLTYETDVHTRHSTINRNSRSSTPYDRAAVPEILG